MLEGWISKHAGLAMGECPCCSDELVDGVCPSCGLAAVQKTYGTIVIDPPWPHADSGKRNGNDSGFWQSHHVAASTVPYDRMTLDAIAGLPVGDLADPNAHLYLWTTNGFLREAFDILAGWGFRYSTTLVWAKAPRGLGFGGAHTITTEFVLFGRRGKLATKGRSDSTWFPWKRPYENGAAAHSRKPDGFLDLVEQVSPGPYVECFARRQRFGWEYVWGDFDKTEVGA